MELKDEIVIAATPSRVFEALNDVDVLRQCIPGCEDLTRTADDTFEAKVMLKVGPVRTRFSGKVELDAAEAPARFSLAGQGNGGAAGFARGTADVELEERGGSTVLRYDARADVGGKLAQLGGRLIQSTAKKLAGSFFERFRQVLDGGQGD